MHYGGNTAYMSAFPKHGIWYTGGLYEKTACRLGACKNRRIFSVGF